MFVGCVVGCSPFFGFHLWICLGLAWLLRLNRLVVVAASNLSIPPVAPFLAFASVQAGEFLLRGEFLDLRTEDFTAKALPDLVLRFLGAWVLGGAVVGAAIGAVAGAVLLALLSRRRPRSS